MIGKTLSHYTIVSRLGRGGMGEVYLAADAKLKRNVALKVLPPDMASDPADLRRFQREAEVVAALNHANIVTIYSLEEARPEDGSPQGRSVHFLTMEVVDGQTLTEVIPGGGMELDQLLSLAIPLVDAVAVAHASGVIHRDLKPGNVMVTEDGRVKVLDFGLAKLARSRGSIAESTDPLTREGDLLGTVQYMSPEQVRERDMDHRSDIFSLGLLLYEMATGSRPFARPSPAETIGALLRDAPPPLADRRPDLPPVLETVLSRCLEKEPGARFQSAGELREELEGLGLATEQEGLRAVRRPAAAPAAKSIAVLPFVNLSAEADNEYFSDGVSEEIINSLGHLSELRVAARTSSFAFKGTQTSVREIGAALNVANLLEGSVRRSGSRLRITTRLTDVETGYQLWSERFDREMDDVFAIQDEIAGTIAERLELALAAAQPQRPGRATPHLEAYDLYLKGRFFWEQRGEGMRQGLVLLQRALEIDPDYALAHAGLADCHNLLAFYGLTAAHDSLPKAEAAARRALELDDQLAEAHTALGLTEQWLHWDWDAGRDSLQRGIAINPGYVNAHTWYGLVDRCWARAKFDDAHRELDLALEMDPLNPSPLFTKVVALLSEGRDREALACAHQVTELAPTSYLAWRVLGQSLQALGRFEEALEAFEKALALSNRHSWLLADTAEMLHAVGRKKEGERVWREFLDQPGASPVVAAISRVRLGRGDEAIEYVERACEERDPLLVVLRTWPAFDPIRQLPAFEAVMDRLAFPRE